MEETKQLHPLLGTFKERMKIFHDAEDGNLSRMLTSSEKAILDLTGALICQILALKSLFWNVQDICTTIRSSFSLQIFKENSLSYHFKTTQ